MPSQGPPRAAAAWLAWWIVLAALYALLADNAALPELIAGAVIAAIGATGAVLVRSQRQLLLQPQARWLRGAWRPVLGLVGDLRPLVGALVESGLARRPGRSGFVEVPFDAVGEDPESTAYRALTEAFGSLAPNTVVVEMDAERGVLIAHQLRKTDDATAAAAAAPLPR
jgi:multisubunit Na+/H+ antiporter MnhE subunit